MLSKNESKNELELVEEPAKDISKDGANELVKDSPKDISKVEANEPAKKAEKKPFKREKASEILRPWTSDGTMPVINQRYEDGSHAIRYPKKRYSI
jgi:hypothetical protein